MSDNNDNLNNSYHIFEESIIQINNKYLQLRAHILNFLFVIRGKRSR